MSKQELVLDPKITKMIEPQAEVKKVKIRTIRPCMIDGKIVPENQEVMATPEEAAEFCDKKFKGGYAFEGLRTAPVIDEVTRAVRV